MKTSESKSFARKLVDNADWLAALVVFVASFVVALASGAVRAEGREVLFVNGAISIAVLGAVLAVLTILVPFFGDELLAILEDTEEGVGGAFRPFIIVAILAAASTIIGGFSAFLYPVALSRFQAFLLALSNASLVAAVVGTVQVVELAVFFGTERAKLGQGMRHADSERKRRLREEKSA